MITAANGKALPLLTVIAKCLHYMKNVIISYLDKQMSNPYRKIQWILTVPAIWSPGAKQMMREAAKLVRKYIKSHMHASVLYAHTCLVILWITSKENLSFRA